MKPSNPKLYAKVKAEADAKFLAKTSAYKSAWIVREYKKRGGRYDEAKPSQTTGLTRWFKEKWVDLNRPGEVCGRPRATTKGTYPLCRPSVKVTDATPKLAKDVKNVKDKVNKEKQKLKHKGRVKF